MVEYVYNMEYTLNFTIKYEYKNNGLYSSSLNNVVLMEFPSFAQLLGRYINEGVLNSPQFQSFFFKMLDKSGLAKA
jgi:hypothetical protein